MWRGSEKNSNFYNPERVKGTVVPTPDLLPHTYMYIDIKTSSCTLLWSSSQSLALAAAIAAGEQD